MSQIVIPTIHIKIAKQITTSVSFYEKVRSSGSDPLGRYPIIRPSTPFVPKKTKKNPKKLEHFYTNLLSIYMEGCFYRTLSIVYKFRGDKMKNEKTKVECRLTTHGTEKANAKVVDDLIVPDPDPAVGKQVIVDIIEEEKDNDDKPETS